MKEAVTDVIYIFYSSCRGRGRGQMPLKRLSRWCLF